MTIAVLGGMGFVGRHLIQRLVDADEDVVCIDNYSRGGPSDKWSGLYRSIKCLDTDVTLPKKLVKDFKDYNIDTVYNLAASVAGIYHNIEHQFSMYAANWLCAYGPITAAVNAGVKNFLQVSSVCVYDPVAQDSYRDVGGVPEDAGLIGMPQGANAGYAEAKRDAERLLLWAIESFQRAVIVRPSNIIGPGDWFDDRAHVVPALIRRVVNESVLTVYGNRTHQREFVDVRDVARAMTMIMNAVELPLALNIGSGNVISIDGLANRVVDVSGTGKKIAFVESEGGDKFRLSNSSRLRELGWEPDYSIFDSVRDCFDDYIS